MKILIVDDEPVSRKTLQKLLESVGECIVMACGEDVLAMNTSTDLPDLILLDILMPGISGYDVCGELKKNPATKTIPIIFLSANTKIEDKTRGFELGAVDYITKPFHKEEVKARVKTHLNLKKIQEDLFAQTIVLENRLMEIQQKTELLRQKDLQLIEMDRMASIGTLAAGIAHEINTPLGFIKSTTGFLIKSTKNMIEAISYWDNKAIPDELMKEFQDLLQTMNFSYLTDSLEKKHDRIARGIERIIQIINSLKSISRIDMEAIGELDLNRSITEVIDILRGQETKQIDFIKEFDDVPRIRCLANEINRCLLNVIQNAMDAIEEKGSIQIITKFDKEESRITIHVIDTGAGMSPEVLREAKNPFFTTKPVGSGTGVGLSITDSIIKKHGGTLELFSKENEGTTVTITLHKMINECIPVDDAIQER